MGFLERIRTILQRRFPVPLNERFFVTFDDDAVHIRAEPPGEDAWSQEFRWNTVTQVCFQSRDFFYSDEILVYTTQHSEPHVIPIEARGGNELWEAILRRHLFDLAMSAEAMRSTNNELFCWPPIATAGHETTPGN